MCDLLGTAGAMKQALTTSFNRDPIWGTPHPAFVRPTSRKVKSASRSKSK